MKIRMSDPTLQEITATYDTEEAELILRRQHTIVTLDEWECDNLLRLEEHAISPDQADADLTEFFAGEVHGEYAARLFARIFSNIAPQLSTHVYDTIIP